MKVETPMKMFYENMLLNRKGDIWAYYLIEPDFISRNNASKKDDSKNNWAHLFEQLKNYKDIDLKMIPQNLDLKPKFETLSKVFGQDKEEIANYYANETIRLLTEDLGYISKDRFYLGVKLKSINLAPTIQESLKESYDQIFKTLATGLGFEVDGDVKLFKRMLYAENNLYQSLSSMGAVRVSEKMNLYLSRFNFVRGIQSHEIRDDVMTTDVGSITNTIIDPTEKGVLKLTTAEGESYVAFVPVGAVPRNMAYAHLFEQAQLFNFPVEFHIKASYKEIRGLSGLSMKTKNLKRRFKVTDKESRMTGDATSDRVKIGRYMINTLENDIDNSRAIMDWLACFVVTGDSLKQVKSRVNVLIKSLGTRKISAYPAIADQLQLFYKFLDGTDLGIQRSWVQRSNAETFAENLFAVSESLGNDSGWYIGKIIELYSGKGRKLKDSLLYSRNLVFLNPFAVNELDDVKSNSPHIAFTGETGKGKSFLSGLVFFYLSLMEGKGLLIDPKKEKRGWYQQVIDDPVMQRQYPLFVDHLKSFHYVTLDETDPKNWGVLDPICFLKGSEAKDTAEAMIEQVYDMSKDDKIRTAVLKSIRSVISRKEQGEQVGLLNVVDDLMASDNELVNGAGELIFEMVQDSVLRLAFSHGENEGISFDHKVTILEINNFDLPESDTNPTDYTISNKKSISLMFALGRFCAKFGAMNRDVKTFEFFDEAWIFTTAKGGKAILRSMRRVGRSFNNILGLMTQSVYDIKNEEDHGNFGTIFAFDEPAEREEILKHIGVEVTKDNIKVLGNMRTGQCFYHDIQGRVGTIGVHSLFEEWTKALQTVKKTASSQAETEFAS